jgi:hypothetical protein
VKYFLKFYSVNRKQISASKLVKLICHKKFVRTIFVTRVIVKNRKIKITILQCLGCGYYGEVWEAILTNGSEDQVKVAMKTTKDPGRKRRDNMKCVRFSITPVVFTSMRFHSSDDNAFAITLLS